MKKHSILYLLLSLSCIISASAADDSESLSRLALLASEWLNASTASQADYSADGKVNLSDFAILAKDWGIQNKISDHVSLIAIDYGYDFNSPDYTYDDEYDFEVWVQTDETVERIEFQTPTGNLFEMDGDSVLYTTYGHVEITIEYNYEEDFYGWCYEDESISLDDFGKYGDGLYTIIIHYKDGTSQQTDVWFGQPDSSSPILQPTQRGVFTSFSDGATIVSPLTVNWLPCTDPNAQWIWFEAENEYLDECIEIDLLPDATGLDEPLELDAGQWELGVNFATYYLFENSDGILIDIAKYTESNYIADCVGDLSDHVDYMEVGTERCYSSSSDDIDLGLEIMINTDDMVEQIDIQAPNGTVFIIPNEGSTYPDFEYGEIETCWEELDEGDGYEWECSITFDTVDSYNDYLLGDYTFTIHYYGGAADHTVVRYCKPGTNEPIGQITQKPVITTVYPGDAVVSPVMFEWLPCTEPAVNRISLDLNNEDESIDCIEYALPVSAVGIAEPVELQQSDSWEAYLLFVNLHEYVNDDGIDVVVASASSTEFDFTSLGTSGSLSD